MRAVKAKMVKAVECALPRIRSLQRQYKRQAEVEAPVRTTFETEHLVLGLSMLSSGIVYLAVFAPLAWMSARGSGGDPIGSLLLLNLPPQLDPAFFGETFPRWSSPEARPVLYSLGALYGATGVIAPLVLMAGGLTRLVVSSNGLVWGFFLTRFVTVDLIGLLPESAIPSRFFGLKLAYVMLSFYAANALTNVMSKDDIAREKFQFLFFGGQALFASWVLAKGFGAEATVYTGTIYVACTFLTLAISEAVFRRFFRLARIFVGEGFTQFAEARYSSFGSLFGAAKVASYHERALVAILGGVALVFPLLGFGVYHLLLEGT